jgi:hypothetical protein
VKAKTSKFQMMNSDEILQKEQLEVRKHKRKMDALPYFIKQMKLNCCLKSSNNNQFDVDKIQIKLDQLSGANPEDGSGREPEKSGKEKVMTIEDIKIERAKAYKVKDETTKIASALENDYI